MKKYFGLSLVFAMMINGTASADTDDSVNTFNITITNATSSVCSLFDYRLIRGDFFVGTFLAQFIPPQTTAYPILLNACSSAELELTYVCGENKSITINSQDTAYWFSNEISGKIVSSQQMNATYKIRSGWNHSAIDWRLE